MAVTVWHLSTGAQTSSLRDGNIDVAFGYLPFSETGEIVSELLHDDPLIGVILPADHPLVEREPLWLRDLESLALLGISPEINPVTFDSVMAGLAERGLNAELANVQAVGTHAVSLVAQGCCWKLASPTMIEEANAQPGVRFRPFADPPLPFGLYLRRTGESASPLVQQFVGICRALAAKLSRKVRPVLSLAFQGLELVLSGQAIFS
jgi:DNA-binding transcriptional LysR family regulator